MRHGKDARVISVPGRVNLIGEHIDYHNLDVLPIAIQRGIRLTYTPRRDRIIHVASDQRFGAREFEWNDSLEPGRAGDWVNYVKAAAKAVGRRWSLPFGIDAEVSSDLPPAAGLSSSSALLTAVALALLDANGIQPAFDELMELLPEGEQFVGTRGGAMDHAAILAGRADCAMRIGFVPLTIQQVPIPPGWRFLIADSGIRAEKSAAVRAEYNARRTAGVNALRRLHVESYAEALRSPQLASLGGRLADDERRAFDHVTGEALRVEHAVRAMESGNAAEFGHLMVASHESLRDNLRVSCAELDAIVDSALKGGAYGARLTGAGFGGSAVLLCGEDFNAPVGASEVFEIQASAGAIARFGEPPISTGLR
ncbi:MAG TPA: galactokinase family protein [Bryobacteraceae bacterium]|nr:galactokinase family protein [Bryobacteraceae bacterium]